MPVRPVDPPIRKYAELTGPLQEPAARGRRRQGRQYRVQFRSMQGAHSTRRLMFSVMLALLNVAIEVAFFIWYLQPGHYSGHSSSRLIQVANIIVVVTLGTVESLRLINVVSLSLASVIARYPVPVFPAEGLRVAFATTYVPGSESLTMLRRTLSAAKKITYPGGSIDVWLFDEGNGLDEGNGVSAKTVCQSLGVNHFSRRGRAEWNQKKGAYAAKKKHGNYNAWLAYLEEKGIEYDVLIACDTDHVAVATMAERMLGYFRDPNVAFVVAPQFYGNSDERLLTRGAESQQFPFHSLIQPAGNRYDGPMLVGTNFAMRMKPLAQVGGFCDSVTEDMATGIRIHSERNPLTRKRWRSVYTPDLVAVGEGPSNFGEYFNQQLRWSRGTFQLLSGMFWRRMWRMSPGKIFHYLLIMSFYPSMAIGWLFGILNVCLVLGLGATGLAMPIAIWVMFYALATTTQLGLYIAHRDHNVSPFEHKESAGLIGMVMSVLVAPMYTAAMLATIFRMPNKFVVTPKGEHSVSDRPAAFWRHSLWAVVIIAAIVAAFARGGEPLVAFGWPAMQLAICLTPMVWSASCQIKTARAAKRASETETERPRLEVVA